MGIMPKALASLAMCVAEALQPAAAVAQETTQPEVRSDGYFANFFHFEFKPGKSDEGLEILKETLIPAYRRAGVDVKLIEDMMGTKNLYLIIPLRSGPAYYSYVLPPQDADAWRALTAMSGDPAEAERRLDRFVDLLARQWQTMIFVPRLEAQ